MQHRGEIVEKAIRESGYSITKLAQKLGKSRRWMYLAFENSDLTIEIILEVGQIIHHDFSDDLNQLKKYPFTKVQQLLEEPKKSIGKSEDADHWKNKYLLLLEKYNVLLLTSNERAKKTTKKNVKNKK